jgi:hypothetical protein
MGPETQPREASSRLTVRSEKLSTYGKDEADERQPAALKRRILVASILPTRDTVACWIGVVQEIDRRIVRVAGRLTEACAPELLLACNANGSVEVDLSDIMSVDPIGVEVLRRIRRGGAQLVGVPAYIQMKLDGPNETTNIPTRPR